MLTWATFREQLRIGILNDNPQTDPETPLVGCSTADLPEVGAEYPLRPYRSPQNR